MIREAKKCDYFKNLVRNREFETIYKTLGLEKLQQQVSNLADLEVMKEYFANIRSRLVSKMPEIQAKTDIVRKEETRVVHPTNA